MNESGGPVAKLLGYYKIDPDHLVVVHDELDLEPGQLRVKFGGGDNGHNGLRSIRGSLGTGDFYRVRIGVGRPPGRQEPADFLLSNFPASAREDVAVEVNRAADAVESLVERRSGADPERVQLLSRRIWPAVDTLVRVPALRPSRAPQSGPTRGPVRRVRATDPWVVGRQPVAWAGDPFGTRRAFLHRTHHLRDHR